MKDKLQIGTTLSGAPFTLPPEIVMRTLGVIGIRGSGKTRPVQKPWSLIFLQTVG